jgi:hypothetical protein
MARTAARAFLLDPRLLIGVALVVCSVVGVVAIVSAADESVEVLATDTALVPGDRVTLNALSVRSVRLDAMAHGYLTPGDVPADGVVVTRAVGAGELVPAAAVGRSDGVRMASLVLSSEGALAASVGPGSPVDIWSAPAVEGGYAEPLVIVPGATVVRLVETRTIVSGGAVTGVEVLVPRARIAAVLAAVANDASISIVPASIPLDR